MEGANNVMSNDSQIHFSNLKSEVKCPHCSLSLTWSTLNMITECLRNTCSWLHHTGPAFSLTARGGRLHWFWSNVSLWENDPLLTWFIIIYLCKQFFQWVYALSCTLKFSSTQHAAHLVNDGSLQSRTEPAILGYHPQLHPIVPMWSLLAPNKEQMLDGHCAKLEAVKRQPPQKTLGSLFPIIVTNRESYLLTMLLIT